MFDLIIAGAGASGLNLAHALGQAGLADLKILLADRAPKTANDRTWCFWEQGDNPLEAIIHRRWSRLAFHGEGFSSVLEPAPYRYKMLRGIDFYQHMDGWIATQPNITRVYGEVQSLRTDAAGVALMVDGTVHRGQFGFNSLPPPLPTQPGYHNLLQHFLGWVIETEHDHFDPDVATLMDFRIDQADDTRFVYVLPLDRRTALVEYTLFSGELLPRAAYAGALRAYIADMLKIEEYQITHDEFGVIPMSDAPVPRMASANVMNIGTAGGASKPSTGYTFVRTQRQAARIAAALKATGQPFYEEPVGAGRFKVFDSTLLNVLDGGGHGGAKVFSGLFRRNPASLIFRFLDEDTTLAEDLRIMASVDIPRFTRAMAAVTLGRRRR
jgi:lycopene beta-cyclase